MLAVAASFFPRVGGGEKYAARYLRGVVEHGATVDVLTTVDGEQGTGIVEGMRVHYVDAKRVGGFPFYSRKLIDRYATMASANVLQTFAPAVHDFALASYARTRRLPLVAVYHADLKEAKGIGWIATRAHNALALRAAAKIVTTNAAVASRLVARGIRRECVSTLVPGVDRAFSADRVRNGGYLLFVGALDEYHRYKRLDLLLEALAAMRRGGASARLRVIGTGSLKAHFESVARELGVANAVDFLGYVSEGDLPSHYANADAFVLPSPTTQEGFGLVCLEAIAAGTPVVCSVAAGVAPIVASTPGCATWNGHAVADLVRAIDAVKNPSDALREQIARTAHAYSWEAMSDVVAHLIAQARAA